jgi:paraquat-inducible protein B
MTESRDTSGTDAAAPGGVASVPLAVPHRPHRARIPLVWVVPAVAALIGAWLGLHAYLEHGPTITVTFRDASGVEAGKTKVRYQSVDIGDVKSVTLAADGRTVHVTLETAKFATPFLRADSQFWIVRPRLGTTGVSGLGTLLSGAFIAMDTGTSTQPARDFTGLERPPAVAGTAMGRQFVLHTADVGSLAVASPAYFHRIQVGQISSVALDPDGRSVTLRVFVDAPYDRFVTRDTRFWHASGVDLEVDSAGFHVQSQSLTTIVAGGIAFEAPPDSAATAPAPEDSRFRLAPNRQVAMQPADETTERYILFFDESLRGLAPGATVEFRGVAVGRVVQLNLTYEVGSGKFRFPVLIDLFPQRLWSPPPAGEARSRTHVLMTRMIKQGFRAQLRTASLLTGQLYVALDFFPRAARVTALPELAPMPLPTLPGDLEQVQSAIVSVARKLDQLPIGSIGRNLDVTLTSLDRALGTVNGVFGKVGSDVVPEAAATLREARGTLAQTQQTLDPDAGLQTDLHRTLSSIGRAADSLRNLADHLDEHPESLIRGRAREPR